MKLYSYIVMHDTGFSPNPFWGYCTLAGCKPVIRRIAREGDWVVGLSPKSDGNRLVYAMRVKEVLTYDKYYRDTRFTAKIPTFDKVDVVHKCGDNIYEPLSNGGFRQLQSMHSKGIEENQKTKADDLRGKNVLVSNKFYYFASRPFDLPDGLQKLKVERGHKSRFDDATISAFLKFIGTRSTGIHAPPSQWKSNNDSWNKSCS